MWTIKLEESGYIYICNNFSKAVCKILPSGNCGIDYEMAQLIVDKVNYDYDNGDCLRYLDQLEDLITSDIMLESNNPESIEKNRKVVDECEDLIKLIVEELEK